MYGSGFGLGGTASGGLMGIAIILIIAAIVKALYDRKKAKDGVEKRKPEIGRTFDNQKTEIKYAKEMLPKLQSRLDRLQTKAAELEAAKANDKKILDVNKRIDECQAEIRYFQWVESLEGEKND